MCQRVSSGLFLRPRDFSEYLGGVERDAEGRVVAARATYMRWFGQAQAKEIVKYLPYMYEMKDFFSLLFSIRNILESRRKLARKDGQTTSL